jgi:hypothetical protein
VNDLGQFEEEALDLVDGVALGRGPLGVLQARDQARGEHLEAHLFHCSALEPEDLAYLEGFVGRRNLPRNAFYRNGEELESASLDCIRKIYAQESIVFKWEKRDVLILDNVLMAHSRNPFKGHRKIAVAMGD